MLAGNATRIHAIDDASPDCERDFYGYTATGRHRAWILYYDTNYDFLCLMNRSVG